MYSQIVAMPDRDLILMHGRDRLVLDVTVRTWKTVRPQFQQLQEYAIFTHTLLYQSLFN